MAGAKSLEQAKLAWRRSPLPAFLRWWGGELTAMLPARLRNWIGRGRDVMWLGIDGGTLTVQRARVHATLARIAPDLPQDMQRAEFAQACRDVDPDDRRLLWVVPASKVLHRRLVMPAAVAADPRRAVGYELDRQTPFAPGQVYYDVRVSADPAPTGHVALDLYVAPRAELEPALARLAAMGAQPDAIDVLATDGTLAGIDLLPPELRPRRVDRRRRANLVLAAACVLLAVLVLSQWLANRRAALTAMQDNVAALRAQATQAEQLRAQLVAGVAGSRFLVERKAGNPSVLVVLDDLTRNLPASAWLDMLTLDTDGGLDIKGEAAKAAALVDALGASKVIIEPKLQGVIVPDPATGKERFELAARVKQQAPANGH